MAAACGGPRLVASTGDVQVSPTAIDFGDVVVGATATRPLTLHNTSQGTRTVHVSAPAPFALDVTLDVPGGAMVDVPLVFGAAEEGPVTGTATVVSDSGTAEVALSGKGVAAPSCSPPDDCHGCDGAALPDGTSCNSGSACLVGGACVAGVCMGTQRSCDDGNACTLDVCVAATGCQHIDGSAQCPAPADPCHAAVCDPKTGCGTVEVDDGTACGPGDCTTAHVCLSGQCRVVAVPEGHTCSPASPCRGQGVCHQGSCDAPAPTVLQPAWRYTPPGNVGALLFEGVTDAAGNLYWVECNTNNAAAYPCAFVSYSPQGLLRFRSASFSVSAMPVRQLIAGGRIIAATPSGRLVAASTSTGAVVWDRDLVLSSGATVLRDLAADDARVWVNVDLIGDEMPSVYSDVVIVDAATGAVLTTVSNTPMPYNRGLVLDAAGTAYTLRDHNGAFQLMSISPAGTPTLTLPDVEGPPVSLYNGQLVTRPGSVRSAIDGSSLVPELNGWMQVPWQTPLMSAAARWMLGSTNACAWCEACECASTAVIDLSARSYVAGSGTQRFDHLLGWDDAAITDGVLLSDSSVLYAGRTAQQAATLIELDAQGLEVFACVLPEPLVNSNVSFNYSGAVALTSGQWAVVKHIDCPVCTHNPPPELDVFAVPGLVEASSGWTGRFGGPSRANRPH